MRRIPTHFVQELEHYLAAGVMKVVQPAEFPTQYVVNDVDEQVGLGLVFCADGHQSSHMLNTEVHYCEELAALLMQHGMNHDVCVHTHTPHGGGLVLSVPELWYGEWKEKQLDHRATALSEIKRGMGIKHNNALILVAHAICGAVPESFTHLSNYAIALAAAKKVAMDELELQRGQVMTHLQLYLPDGVRVMYHLCCHQLETFHGLSLEEMTLAVTQSRSIDLECAA